MTRLRPNASTALAYARDQHKAPTRDWSGYCLAFVRSSFGAPAMGGDAHSAWHAAKIRHPLDRKAPAGVPLFFRGGDHGHVVLSRGRRWWLPGARLRCWSTDFVRAGKVDRTTVEAIEASSWGMTYVGWSEDINGTAVTGFAQPSRPPAHARHVSFHRRLRLGMRGADVKDMKAHLWGRPVRSAVYGPASRRKVVRLQRSSPRLGKADGVVGPLTYAAITGHR